MPKAMDNDSSGDALFKIARHHVGKDLTSVKRLSVAVPKQQVSGAKRRASIPMDLSTGCGGDVDCKRFTTRSIAWNRRAQVA